MLAHLGDTLMAVPLQLNLRMSQGPPAWQNFVKHHNHLARQSNTDSQRLMKYSLSQFGAHTKWDDDSDPVWFPDQETLTQFLLAWG
jgi:hypothetical protein